MIDASEEFTYKPVKNSKKKVERIETEFIDEEFTYKKAKKSLTVNKRGRPRKNTEEIKIRPKETKQISKVEESSSNVREESATSFDKSIFINKIDKGEFKDINDVIKYALARIEPITNKQTAEGIKKLHKRIKEGYFSRIADVNYYERKRMEYEGEIEKWTDVNDKLEREAVKIGDAVDLCEMAVDSEIKTNKIDMEIIKAEMARKADEIQRAEDKILFKFEQSKKKTNKMIANIFEATEEDQMSPQLLLNALTFLKR